MPRYKVRGQRDGSIEFTAPVVASDGPGAIQKFIAQVDDRESFQVSGYEVIPFHGG